jgi:RNA polymerase sigma-70 factor (ECF subfamily)
MLSHPGLVLAERCRLGVPGAFDQLYGAQAPRVLALARRMVGNQEAQDLSQDIFLSVHQKIRLYRGESSLATWLMTLGRNRCLDHLDRRASRSMREVPLADCSSAFGSIGVAATMCDRLDLQKAIAALPSGCRLVFVLYDVCGWTHDEIAARLGIAVGTSKSQLNRARQRLRTRLVPHARSRRLASA